MARIRLSLLFWFFVTSLAHAATGRDLVRLLHQSPPGMISVVEGDGAPLVLVQGIDLSERAPEWEAPLERLSSQGRRTYFFKWSKHRSLADNSRLFESALRELLARHPDGPLTLAAYSAGGVMAGLALARMPLAETTRLHFHTMASPFFGYGAPPVVAYMGAPVAGVGAIDIGRGQSRVALDPSRFSQCTHWVTTNCALDMHACEDHGRFPQTGRRGQELPCGNQNRVDLNDVSHIGVVDRVLGLLP